MTVNIGSLTNVPGPGDDIRSPWAQDVTKLGVHVFPSKAALDAQWPAAPNGAQAVTLDTGTRYERSSGVWLGGWVLISAFLNGWTNFGTGYEAAGYRRVGDRVELCGLVKPGALSVPMFALPAGYRPPQANGVLLTGLTEASVGVPNVCRVFAQSNGSVAAANGVTFVSLGGLSFSTTSLTA